MTAASSEETASRRSAHFAVSAGVVILAVFYLYVWRRIGPHLLFHQRSPIFLTTFGFFEKFLRRPRGLLEYVSAFLMQLCSFPWLGALVITAIAGLICLGTRGLLRVMHDGRIHPAAYFTPAVLLLMVHGQYRHRLATSVALLGALALANAYVRLRPRRSWVRGAVFLILVGIFYYAAGGMVVLFGALCGLFELLKSRRIVLGVLCILLAAALPLAVATYSYRISTVEAYVPLLLPDEGALLPTRYPLVRQLVFHAVLLLFFPAAAILAGLSKQGGASGRKPGSLRRRGDEDVTTIPPTHSPANAWTAISFAVFLIVSAILTAVSFDAGAKTRLQIDYHADHEQWDAVLESARRLSPRFYDLYAVHDVNRALYHTGRLPDEMLDFPQRGVPGIRLTPEQKDLIGYRKFAHFSLELGRVNFAQHWGHTAIEIKGERPSLMKLLVKVCVLKNRPELARTFLRSLKKSLLGRSWAKEYLRRLDADPQMTEDPELQHVRSVMLRRDYGYGGFGGFTYHEALLQPLLRNRRNRMAFEYLMAYFLLQKRPDLVVANLHRLADFDYVGIPRHYEEAILVHRRLNPDAKQDLRGRRVRPETVERFRGFYRDVLHYERSKGAEKGAALRTLTERWGNTYFFYFTFGHSEPRPGWKITGPETEAGATE
ncbi:MAG: hypothetical protein AMS16_02715 [Planctomycetes bacterium DG_58]|nr:MAG: hypothetical protein AMS16_02715 [Planctomycetes bacterium DG_58]